jgi:hypothetical protein
VRLPRNSPLTFQKQRQTSLDADAGYRALTIRVKGISPTGPAENAQTR